jgi:serine/threonine protein kinase
MPKKGSNLISAFEIYTVEAEIGGGGSGVVCLVKDGQQNKFAAKVLKAGLTGLKLKRFQNEMMFCWKEDHPHLIRVLDYGRSQDGDPFYVMPLASATLRSLLAAGIGRHDVLRLFSEILDGVDAAHLKGVIHRDLKPENILRDQESGALKIADFGIAHFKEDDLHTQVETSANERLASWEYAAPEQRRAGAGVDKRADIYSIGLILTEMFTGQVPHGADPTTITSVAPEYAYLDEIAIAMRQNSPDKRPASVAQIKNMLIARGSEFVQQQKLDLLRNTVIPANEISDPLVNDPIHVVDADYSYGHLIFTLNQPMPGGNASFETWAAIRASSAASQNASSSAIEPRPSRRRNKRLRWSPITSRITFSAQTGSTR